SRYAASSAWARATSRRWSPSTASTSAPSRSPTSRSSPGRSARAPSLCPTSSSSSAPRSIRKPTRERDAGLHPLPDHVARRSGMSLHLILKNLDEPGLNTLEVYRRRGGYGERMLKALRMQPEELVEELKASGLRGRGGAGFS